MIIGLTVKTAVVLGAAVLGVEYGRRHPESPWKDLWTLIENKLRRAQRAVDQHRQAHKEAAAAAEAPEAGLEDDGQPVPPPGAGADTPAWDPGCTGSQPPPPAATVGDAPAFPESSEHERV